MPRKRRKLVEQDVKVSEKYGTRMPEPKVGESDVAYYKRMAHAMNDRLRALERLAKSGNSHFRNILKYAYANAQYDITAITESEVKRRFPESVPKTKDGEINRVELHRRINAVKRFYESPTSTKTGIIDVYQTRADKLNETLKSDEYGYNGNEVFTWEDMANYYESDLAQKFATTKGGSKTVMIALITIKENMNDPEKIKQAKEGNLKLDEDEVVNKTIENLLKSGLDPNKVFNRKAKEIKRNTTRRKKRK